jgi:hypothetical protein
LVLILSEKMNAKELIASKRNDILHLARSYGAYDIRLFGSVARGTAGPDSDIDFLVELEKGRSLLDLGGLLIDLEKLLKCKVDVVTKAGLRDRIRDRVLKEATPL